MSLAAPKTRLVPKSPINRALNALGDRWSLLVVQEAFLGATRFEEFHARLGGARSTLAHRREVLLTFCCGAELLRSLTIRSIPRPTLTTSQDFSWI